jgi:hypothetical protein
MSAETQFEHFLETDEPADLGPGPRRGVRSQSDLESKLKPLLQASGLEDRRQALVLSLILLWHDHLDAAHSIAQNVETPDGAFVHGILHRREPDFGNAAYWFRRVGRHPAFESLAERVGALGQTPAEKRLAERLLPNGHWDPFVFIDACAGARDPEGQKLLRQVQREEFGVLLRSLAEALT